MSIREAPADRRNRRGDLGLTAGSESGELRVTFWVTVSTGFIGFVVTWMRDRTGSLVAPMLYHNISNVAQAFV